MSRLPESSRHNKGIFVGEGPTVVKHRRPRQPVREAVQLPLYPELAPANGFQNENSDPESSQGESWTFIERWRRKYAEGRGTESDGGPKGQT